jgi:adenylate cyclase class 2
MPPGKPEIEIKIAVQDPAAMHEMILNAGFHVHVARVFEANVLYDFADLRLRTHGKILRLREAGEVFTLTFKGKATDVRYKVREEVETTLGNGAAVARVFQELDLGPVFRYEKYRTEYASGVGGVITLDETPIGTFLEIEGEPHWIDQTAKQLGFTTTDYILASYGVLYLQHCRKLGVEPSNMVFGSEG